MTVRMLPQIHRLAGVASRFDGRAIGEWIEEAIIEKVQRERPNLFTQLDIELPPLPDTEE